MFIAALFAASAFATSAAGGGGASAFSFISDDRFHGIS